MVNVYSKDGKILLVNNKVAASQNCCCGSSSCPNKTCSDLPSSFNADLIFQNYLTQYSPKNLTFTDVGGGVWGANDTATAAGCPNIDIGFTIFCTPITGQPSLLSYALNLTCNGFGVDNTTDLIISTDTGESLTSDVNCNLVLPTFYINFIIPLTFTGDLFLNFGVGGGCNS